MANEPPGRVHALFDAALEQPAHARLDFLRNACGDDAALFRELADLLEVYGRIDAEEHGGLDPAETDLIGSLLGPYRVQRLLGAGGMGRVYLANRADGAFEKNVAVKVVHPRATDEEVIARFEDECRILASLQHPNIAGLLDAGRTPDRRLYFIMEYVDGVPITAHCERAALPIPDRVGLMRHVCEAVSFAHRNLIVHRDLKPANILVDAEGRPKLLDFGIAKALTRAGLEMSDPTHPLKKRATPAYASPEQLRGETAHTGMDVFALGVILHELITGERPVPVAPDAPTTLGAGAYRPPSRVLGDPVVAGNRRPRPGDLAADLDAIVLKALAGDPRERYASVESLSRDLQALLERRPVSARRPVAAYRVRKFVRRNRLAVALSAAALAAGLVAVGSLTYSWNRARLERAEAIRRFEQLQTLAGSLFAVDRTLAGVPGTTAAREALTTSLSAYLAGLRASAAGDPRILLDVAESYRRVGDVQGNPNGANLGDTSAALASYAAAAEILRALGDHAGSPEASAALAETLASRGDVHAARQERQEASRSYDEALAIAERLAAARPDDPRYPAILARIHRPLGDLAIAAGRADEALASYERALSLELALVRRSGDAPERQRLIALTRLRTAAARERQGEWREARRQYSAAVEALRALNDGETSGLLRDTAVGLTRLASVTQAGDPTAAAELLRDAIATFRRLAAADAADARVRRDLYLALVQQGDLLLAADPEAAQANYREARSLADASGAGPGRDARIDEDLALIRGRLAAGPAAVAPRLRLFANTQGRRVLIGAGDPVPLDADSITAAADAPAGWSRYLVVFGAEGEARVLDEAHLAATRWTLPLTGPPPAQTVLLLTVPRPLSSDERRILASGIGAVPGPRAIDWDSQVLWASEETDTRVLSTASARGARDAAWIRTIRAQLDKIPGARFTGRTFPIAPAGS